MTEPEVVTTYTCIVQVHRQTSDNSGIGFEGSKCSTYVFCAQQSYSAVPVGILCVDPSNVQIGAGDHERPNDGEEHQQSNDTVDDGNSPSLGFGEIDDQRSGECPRTPGWNSCGVNGG